MSRSRKTTDAATADGPGWRDYSDVLRRQAPVILIAVLVGALIGAASAANTPRRYTARAQVRLTATTSPFTSSGGRSTDLTRALLTEIQVAKGDAVETRLAESMNTTGITMDVLPGAETDTILLSATAATRDDAAEAANAYARAYIAERASRISTALTDLKKQSQDQIIDIQAQITELNKQTNLDKTTMDAQRAGLTDAIKTLQNRVNTASQDAAINPSGAEMLTAATPPGGSSSTALSTAGIIGGGLGLLLGLLVAGLLELFSKKVQSAVRARRLLKDAPIYDTNTTRRDAISSDLRILAASLRPGTINGSHLAVGVPVDQGTAAQETMATIAVMLASSGISTTLVDATSGTSAQPGLWELLQGERRLDEVLRSTDAMPLQFMSGGGAPARASDIDGDRLASVLYELTKHSRAVLVLLPPPLRAPMAATVARTADDVVVFLNASSRKADISDTVDVLEALGADLTAAAFVGRPGRTTEDQDVVDATRAPEPADSSSGRA